MGLVYKPDNVSLADAVRVLMVLSSTTSCSDSESPPRREVPDAPPGVLPPDSE